jgi:hypothetical protein
MIGRYPDDKTAVQIDKMTCGVLRCIEHEFSDLTAKRIEELSAAMVKILAHRPSYNHHSDSTLPDGLGITTTVDESDYNDLQTYARNALRGVL